MQALVQDAFARQVPDEDGVVSGSEVVSVSPPAEDGAEIVDATLPTADHAGAPPPNPLTDTGVPPVSSDLLDGESEEGRAQGSADSGDESGTSPAGPRQDQVARRVEEAATPGPDPVIGEKVSSVSGASTEQADDPDEEDRPEAELAASVEDEVHSPNEHARPETDSEFQDASVSCDVPETADKATSQPSVAPAATGRDAAAWALAQGWLAGSDEADGAPVPAGASGDEPVTSDEEAANSAADESVEVAEVQDRAEEVETPGSCPSPDDRVSPVSEASIERAADPDAEDHSEAEIAVATNEAEHPSNEHARPEADSEFQDEDASAEEEEVADSAGDDPVATAIPDVDPDLEAVIVNRAVYDILVTRATSLKSSEVVDLVLADPSVEVPPDTQPRVIGPGVLGKGVEHADVWSLVFVPDDGRSPIHQILFDKDGTIVGRVGPYHRA